MLTNYLKIAWRNLKKQPFFTSLNTFGLAIGLTGALLIGLYVADELSFNKDFKDAERIHRVNVDINFGGSDQQFAVAVAPMAETMKRDFSEIEDATRLRTWGSMLIRKPDAVQNQKESLSSYADKNFLTFFGIQVIEGDANSALNDPNSVVLTESTAKKYFGNEKAVGQSIMINNEEIFRVTGVIEDMPMNSFLRNYTVFMSMEGYEDARDTRWGSHNYATFLKLIPSVAGADLEGPFNQVFEKYVIPYAYKFIPDFDLESFNAAGNYVRYSSVPLTELQTSGNRVAEVNPNGTSQTVYILSLIALFLIILAVVNYMNLSTAQSLKRAKEVGIRKTLGSQKSGLMAQFLTESGLIAFMSLLAALVLAFCLMPYFNSLSGKELSIPFTNPLFWLIILAGTLILGFASGSYPSFFMSRFMPVKVLRGTGKTTGGGSGIRNALVVFQFVVSIFLIVGTIVVFQQLNYIQNKDLGYAKEQVLILDDVYAAGDQIVSFKNEVTGLSGVKSATLSSFLPTPSNRSDSGFDLTVNGEKNTVQMQNWAVDFDYVQTLDLEIIAGRDFDPSFATDSNAYILNETAISVLGLSPEEAIGKKISHQFDDGTVEFYPILGVVKNFHYESFKDEIGALGMHYGPYANKMTVKLTGGEFTASIDQIKAGWERVAKGQPFNHYFLDDSFNSSYEAEQRLGSIIMTFTILSLFVACLGLFGLAAFNAQKRFKEIGVRKVMGASVNQIAAKLSLDFLKLVGVAIFVALPLSWYIMNIWLQDFSYRIEISWWILVLAAFSATLIALLTVSYKAIKAALVNPVKSLRSE